MNLFLNILVSSAIQIIVMGLIPFIWWLVTAREKETFFAWIGLKNFKEMKKSAFRQL